MWTKAWASPTLCGGPTAAQGNKNESEVPSLKGAWLQPSEFTRYFDPTRLDSQANIVINFTKDRVHVCDMDWYVHWQAWEAPATALAAE